MQHSVLFSPSMRGYGRSQWHLELLTGLLDSLSARKFVSSKQSCCHQRLSVLEPCRSYIPFNHPWIYVLDMDGFYSKEIKLRVNGNKVFVHARHEDIDGEDIDIVERKRVLKIPSYVDVKNLSCYIDRRGKMIIKAPFLCEGTEKKCGECEETGEPCSQSKTERNVQLETPINDNDQHEDTDSCTDKETVDDVLEEESVNHDTGDTCQQSEVKDDYLSVTDENKLEGPRVQCGTEQCHILESVENEHDDTSGEFVKVSVESLQHTEEYPMDTMNLDEKDGKKYLSAKIETGDIDVDSIRVHCDDKVLSVYANREHDDEADVVKIFHRRYKLPENACDDQARAFLSDSGYFAINVPIMEKSTEVK